MPLFDVLNNFIKNAWPWAAIECGVDCFQYSVRLCLFVCLFVSATISDTPEPLEILSANFYGSKIWSFPVRIVSLWNRLPANIVLPANLKQFKMAIKNIDFSYALIGKDWV